MLCSKRLDLLAPLDSLNLVRWKDERRIPGHDGYLNLVIFPLAWFYGSDLHRPFGHACRKIMMSARQYVHNVALSSGQGVKPRNH
jgi:hypothetical protein